MIDQVSEPLGPTRPLHGLLPDGWQVRAATEDDHAAVLTVMAASDLALLGHADTTAEELREAWEGRDLADNSWAVLTPGGQVVGYADYSVRGEYVRLMADGYVHPDHLGRGVGTTLVRLTEARAWRDVPLAINDYRVALQNAIVGSDQRAHALLTAEGYDLARYFWRMRMPVDTELAPAVWPEGAEIRVPQSAEEEQQVFATVDRAFRDHWGYNPTTLDQWSQRLKSRGFEPALWFLLTIDGQNAGVVTCGFNDGIGSIRYLAVDPEWRRRGLGRALLLHGFAVLRERGAREIQLDVDAANPTGATTLYESVGMIPLFEIAVYEKELRPGRPWVEATE